MACVLTLELLSWNRMTQSFEEFWSDVIDYANSVGITTQYAEDEFILDGELYCVSVQFVHPTTGEVY